MAKKRIAVKKKARSRPRPEPAAREEHAAPESPGVHIPDLVSPDGVGVPEQIIDELVRTRAWVIVASVLLFIGTATALVFMGLALQTTFAGDESGSLTTGQMISAVVAAVWLVAGIVTVTIAIRMVLFANRISRLEKYRSEDDLEYVLAHVRGFWAMLGGGILVLILVSAVLTLIQINR
ncbi:MAG: hypothetical protein ACI8UO_001379 [Verrucomicrobiales bacterium]|jgi:hypothetical protein